MTPPTGESRRALFLTPELPALGRGGGALRSECLLEYLRRDYEVDIVTFDLRHHSKALPAKVFRNAIRLVRGVPPLFDRFSGYQDQIASKIPPGKYEVGVVEHFWCASYAGLMRERCKRVVLDLHNIESRLAWTHAEALHRPGKWAAQRFARMYEELERQWLPRYHTLLVVSESDGARVRHPDVRVFPNALPEIRVPKVPEANAIVFSGNMEYHPNVEAVRWFASEIWPRIRSRIPDAEWRLVGRNPGAIEDLVRGLAGVRVIGEIDNAVAAIAEARVCVVPLRSGSGTRFKILEAWAAQRPVVSTTVGAEGLGARRGEHLWIADDTAGFADAVVELWNNPERRQHLGEAGRELYRRNFTWPAAWRMLDQSGGL